MSLRARLTLGIGLLVLATLVCAAYFGNQATARMRSGLAQARDVHHLNTVSAYAEYRLTLGLSLEQIDGLQALIERERANDKEIVSIDVFNERGLLVYSTDRGTLGTAVAPAWVTRNRAAANWRLNELTDRVSGARLENDLGEAVGGVAVTLAEPVVPSALLAWMRKAGDGELLRQLALGLVCLLLAAVTVALCVPLLLRPYGRTAVLLRSHGGVPAQGAPSGAAGDLSAAPDAAPPAAFVAEARRRCAHWSQGGRQLEASLAELRALDAAD